MSGSSAHKNLWGVLPQDLDVHPPVALLQQQGEFLKSMTNGLLVGSTTINKYQHGLNVAFSIKAPAINDYLYLVLSVQHGADPYPAKVYDENAETRTPIECGSPEELEKAVAQILQSTGVRRVVSALLKQITFTRQQTVDDAAA